MKRTELERLLKKALLIVISLLLILIGVVLILRPLLIPAGSEVSPAKTVGTGRITADGFTTVFTLAENAAQAAKDYQEHLLESIGLVALGIIGFFYAGALLIYSAIFKLKPKRTPYSIAIMAAIAIWGGSIDQSFLNYDVQQVRNCAQLQSMYDSRQYKIAEGNVHVSYQSSGGGHGENGDIIKVGPLGLEVDPYESTCAYKKIIAFGGVLTEGTYARVYIYAATILRIDVKNQ
jgi:hypothetical protein